MGAGLSAHMGVELIKATADGNLFDVRRLLQQGASPNYTIMTTTKGPLTALWVSVVNGELSILLHLLRAGAPVNVKCGNDRTTALMEAAKRGNTDVMKLLVQVGAQVNLGDKDDDTALHYAALNEESGAAALLLGKNANPNARNNKQSTPLHFACAKGDLEVIMLLKAAGASSHVKNNIGATPADLALLTGNGAAIVLLLAAE